MRKGDLLIPGSQQEEEEERFTHPWQPTRLIGWNLHDEAAVYAILRNDVHPGLSHELASVEARLSKWYT